MKWSIFLVNMLLVSWSEAQMNSALGNNKMKFVGFEFGISVFQGAPQFLGLSEYQSLLDDKQLPNNDILGYTQISSNPSASNSIVRFAMVYSLLNSKGKRLYGDPVVRFGFSVNNLGFNGDFFEKNYRYTIDTVFNSGNMNFIDSTGTVSISAFNNSNRLRFSTELHWQTLPKYRFYLYGGLGFSAGFSTNSTVNYSYRNDGAIQTIDQNGNVLNTLDSYYDSEFNQVGSRLWTDYSFHLPVGLDFRLGNAKRERIYRFLHFFIEVTPSYWVSSAKGIAPTGTAGLLVTWGLRFKLIHWL
jgi:hypothetical protein